MGQTLLWLAIPTAVGVAGAIGAWVGVWLAHVIASSLVDVRRGQ